eukprot:3207978-Pleurochrysis_carterae.AAC.1
MLVAVLSSLRQLDLASLHLLSPPEERKKSVARLRSTGTVHVVWGVEIFETQNVSFLLFSFWHARHAAAGLVGRVKRNATNEVTGTTAGERQQLTEQASKSAQVAHSPDCRAERSAKYVSRDAQSTGR